VGCTKPAEDYDDPSGLNGTYTKKTSIALGRELEDPYAIHNIMKAYESLKLIRGDLPDSEIKPNNVYLRFKPGNEKELELLRSDSTLVLYDYPLNYEITAEYSSALDTYDDTELPYLYCVVPSDKTLPPVHFEIIYSVFIPPDIPSTKGTSSNLVSFYEDLVNESARLTGNIPDDESSYQVKGSQSKWQPKGRIRAWDDLLNQFIPLNHVNVHARWFTRIETDLTDENGYFQMKSFSHKVNYSIKWENSLFSIRNGLFFQAWYNGPRMKGDWILDIRDGKSKMFATIHRAAYRQFYGDNLGMERPVLKTGGRTKICYMDEDGTGKFLGDWSAGGIMPDIQVWGNGNNRATNHIFGIVSHELGHQSHSQYIGNIKFIQTSKIIRESWAEAVEWAMSNDEYNKLGQKYGNSMAINYNHQFYKHNNWPYVDDRDYSPIFIDLVDRINQRVALGPKYPNDLILQYSLSYINQNILMNSKDISSLREEVKKNKLGGVSDFQIQELFLLY